MSVSNRLILEQLPVIAGLGRVAALALGRKVGLKPQSVIPPGPEHFAQVDAPSEALVRAYRHHLSPSGQADGEPWPGLVPAHLFPHWTFPISGKTLMGVPYPLEKVVNGGCRVEVGGPIPLGTPLNLRARLMEIEDDGRKATLYQRVVTGTDTHPEAIVATLRAIVVHGRKGKGSAEGASKGGAAKPASTKASSNSSGPSPVMIIPEGVRRLETWSLGGDAGLSFAKLTGDFNPIHWIPAYARASGFPSTILHGFGTLARAWEGLLASEPGARVAVFDVSFTRPLVLPAQPHLYIDGKGGIFVGDAPGERPYLSGTYTLA